MGVHCSSAAVPLRSDAVRLVPQFAAAAAAGAAQAAGATVGAAAGAAAAAAAVEAAAAETGGALLGQLQRPQHGVSTGEPVQHHGGTAHR